MNGGTAMRAQSTPVVAAGGFVGRTAELDRLRAVADRVRAGEAWSVRIDGAPGVGATALARRFARELDDFNVVMTAASRDETSTPFALIDHLMSRLPRSRCDTPFRYPALRELSPPMVGAEIVHMASELDGDRPIALVIDDLQWADLESVAALRFALRRLGDERLLAVLVGRRGRGAWEGLEHLHDWPERVVGLDLEGLSEADVAELARRTRGVEPEAAIVRRLREVTNGNPLYVGALMRGGADAERFLEGSSDVAPSLVEAVRAVVASFRPSDRAVLEALAVLDRPAAVHQLGAVSGLADAWSIARALVPTGAVHVDGSTDEQTVVLASVAWRDAALALLDVARGREMHRRAAEISEAPQRWRHRVEAADGPDPELCRELELAAQAELGARRYARAADLLLLARRVPDCAATDSKLMTAARLLAVGGRGRRALALQPQVAELEASSDRSETLALLDMLDGTFASARDLLITARRQFERDPATAPDDVVGPSARLALGLAFAHCTLGEGGEAVDAATDALDVLPAGVWADAARTLLATGLALRDGADAGLASMSWLAAEPTAATTSALPGLAHRGALRGLIGELDLAVDDLTAASRRRADVPGLVGLEPHVHLVWCHYQRGAWLTAERALDVAAHSEPFGSSFDRATIRAMSAVLRAGRGEVTGAVADANVAEQLLEGADHVVASIHLALARAAIAQARGSASGVVDALARLGVVVGEPDVLSDRFRLYAGWWLPTLADAQIGCGLLAQAERTVAGLSSCSSRGAMLDVARAWVEGQLLVHRGDRTAALRRFRAGLDTPPRGGEPAWYRAHLRAAYGAALVDAGRVDEGAHLLHASVRSFADMGAAPYAERTERLVERARERAADRSAPDAAPWDAALTAREREVAAFVGLGWTNVEISRELFVSVKTVEHHLRNTFIKLGITSRRELRDRVQADDRSRGG
jgi:DNA-binding CsgD family transcriptional regulator